MSRIRAAPNARLGHLAFEFQGLSPVSAWRRVSYALRQIKLGLYVLEEALDEGTVIAIAFTVHSMPGS